MGFLGSILPAIFGGAASIYGSHEANRTNREIANATNLANRDIANSVNVANAKQAHDVMEFQERMSGSAYQRQMSDMRAAGINPMLAASLGGASTPPGSSVPAVTGSGAVTGAPMMNEMSGVPAAVTSAMDAMRLKLDMQNLKATNSKIMSDTVLNKALTLSAKEDAKLKSNSAKVADINAKNLLFQQPGLLTERMIDESRYGQTLRFLNRMNPFHSGSSSTAKNLSMILR